MSSSSPPSSNTHVRLVVYCDEQPQPHTLPEIPLPHNLEGLRRFIEDKVGLHAKLLSYWNYAHNRYELLRDVRELVQEDGRVFSRSSSRSRPESRVRGSRGSRQDEGLDTSTSWSRTSSAGSATRQTSRLYRCQLWLETVLLQLEPLDPRRDRAEYDELRSHVARWLGNRHIGYEVQDAVRVRCPFLTRMFDETRSTRLEGNQDKVQLLYYSNNVWTVRDVLQYGFLLSRGVPKSMTAVVQALSSTSDVSTTDTHLSIPVPPSVQGPSSVSAMAPVDHALDSTTHPFIFTSSMLGPNVKQLPPRTAPHKVLLCEVAPGRRFMMDQSLTSERSQNQSTPRPPFKAPAGYDSVCYMRTRDDKNSVRSGDEASAKVEDLSVVQVQVAHSYQALPRYLLTVAPTGGPPPPLSSFDSTTVSATASPVRAPGTTAAAAAAREDAEKKKKKEQEAAVTSTPRVSRSGRLRDWWRTSLTPSREKSDASAARGSTPVRRPRGDEGGGSLSAPTYSLSNTPRSGRGGEGYNDDSSARRNTELNSTPRRAVSAVAMPRHVGSRWRGVDTPYPADFDSADTGYDYVSGGKGSVPSPHTDSRLRPCGTAAEANGSDTMREGNPDTYNTASYSRRDATDNSASRVLSLPQWESPMADRASGSFPCVTYGHSGDHTPSREAPQHAVSRASRGLGLAPPTPPSPSRPDGEQNVRNGLLYSGLQVGTKNNDNKGHSNGAQVPHQRAAPSARNSSYYSPERVSVPRDGRRMPPYGSAEGPSANPLIPTDRYEAESYNRDISHNTGGAGGGRDGGGPAAVPSLPGTVPPSSLMRKCLPAVNAPVRRPPQAPPAAFNQFLCPIHPRQLQSLYCTACEELTCPYCASVGDHRDHVVVEATSQVTAVHAEVHKLYEELRHWLSEYRRTAEELRAEQSSHQMRQQRELRGLQQNLQSLRQALLEAEHNMTQSVQRSCPPPLAEASAVIGKYTTALAPVGMALSRYHAAQDGSHTPSAPSSSLVAAPGAHPTASGGRGTTRSIPEMLHFLRTAPPLLRQVQESFAEKHQAEERQLRDSIASYHARVHATEGLYDHVDWVGLRRLLERLGTSRSTRTTSGAATKDRCSPGRDRSPPFFAAEGGAGNRSGSAMRVCGRTSANASPLSRVVSFDSTGDGNVARRLVGRSPVRKLAIGDDLASYVSHHVSPPPPAAFAAVAKQDRLLLRCLEDLQRGHIWAIENASFYFAPGQLKAVCSTSFRLLGAQWELRIAPLPPLYRKARGRRHSRAPSPLSPVVAPGINAGMMATTASTVMPTAASGATDAATVAAAAATRSPLATQSFPDVDERVAFDPIDDNNNGGDGGSDLRHAPPEQEWLGLFLFPQQHRLRMDYRVIAFSEVTWAEWQVTGWTTEMAGKGWGLYPFLQRKELMRTDKLARDNIVKICIAPISDLY